MSDRAYPLCESKSKPSTRRRQSAALGQFLNYRLALQMRERNRTPTGYGAA